MVIAVGFLIFIVMRWNMQSVVFSDMAREEKQNVMEAMKNVTEIDQGQELNDTSDTSESSA